MKTLVLQNRQRLLPVNLGLAREICRVLLDDILGLTEYELAIRLERADRMARANQQYLGHRGSTDVIAFDYRADSTRGKRPRAAIRGDVAVCVDEAVRQAATFHTSWPEEIVRYCVHGVLHLLGFDDLRPSARRVMKARERRLLGSLAAQFDFRHLRRNADKEAPRQLRSQPMARRSAARPRS